MRGSGTIPGLRGAREPVVDCTSMPSRVSASREIMRFCSAIAEPLQLQEGLLDRLGGAVPFDCAFFATTDPDTLLYTNAVRRHMPEGASPAFIRTEFAEEDVNQLRSLVHGPTPIGWLDEATGGKRTSSLRYREAMLPFGLGDELRVALLSEGACWGLLCLHRAGPASGFDRCDIDTVRVIAPYLGAALRHAVVFERGMRDRSEDGTGVVLIAPDRTVLASTPAGARWLDDLAELDRPRSLGLPTVVLSVITRLGAAEQSLPAGARVQVPSGVWLAIHAARMGDGEDPPIALVIEHASPRQIAPLIVAAYGLSPREARVCRGLLVGDPRKVIAQDLRISLHTVNDHVKAIFAKTGASSTGQLRARIFAEHFAQR